MLKTTTMFNMLLEPTHKIMITAMTSTSPYYDVTRSESRDRLQRESKPK